MGWHVQRLDTELDSDQREYLETVKLSADTLLIVINDILDFSKIEAGKIDLEIADFDLRDCLEATLKTLAVRADQKGLELLCEVAPDVPEFVRGDCTRIRQILLNLAGNSIKFTREREIALRVQPDSVEAGNYVLHFTVSDTGIGIPLEKQKVIFEGFSQADNSITRKYGGTGLGLTISARLVGVMGGTLWVESEVGRGSQFHFTLPLGVAGSKPAQAQTMAAPEFLRGVKALIVDDNRTNRRILENMMKRWEMKTISVEGGEEALLELSAAQESREPYALVLTDRHMPGMDGLTLIERIRKWQQFSGATIMMLTSARHRGDAARCQKLKVSAYLYKPIRQSELREAMCRALGANGQPVAAPPSARFSPAEAGAPVESLRILVAEDNAVNQRLIARLLEKRSHHVTLAFNGREALEAIQKENFDLVLMDIQMPEMDGFEATAALRGKEKVTGAHLPVVALTAKPIHPEELDELLKKYLLRRREERISSGRA